MTKRTTRTIAAFTHCNLSGSRERLTIDAGTEVRNVGVDMNDPLYGEAVVWFDANLDSGWTKVGARNMPVLKKGGVAELFADGEAFEAVRDEADD